MEENFEPSLRIGFLMALLTRSIIRVRLLLRFFLLITHIHTRSLTHSISFIDSAAYVRCEVGSRQGVRQIDACPTTTTRGYSWQQEKVRERDGDERTIARRKNKNEKTKKTRAPKKRRRRYSLSLLGVSRPLARSFGPLVVSLLVPRLVIDSTYYYSYLQFRSNGRIARDTFR